MKNSFTILFSILFLSASAQDSTSTIYLWPNGVPGFENRKNEPEQAKDWWVKNVHNPSLTVFLPAKEKANGTAVVICPGGGHRTLVYNSEGIDAANYLTSLGITCFVLKYRLFREENSIYTQDNTIQDGRRAMQLVRKNASQWKLDTNRIGLMGFSAGGELAGWIGFQFPHVDPSKTDELDKIKTRPDFLMLVYPGPAAVPATLPADAPPLFMIAANDDECCSEPIVHLLGMYRAAKLKCEVHLYTQGAHGFNMGKRSKLQTLSTWSQRLGDWLADSGYLIMHN